MKYHIVEYMEDSQVHCYQINIKFRNYPQSLDKMSVFEDEKFSWKVMKNNWWQRLTGSNKKQFQCNGYYVMDIKDIMKQATQSEGNYKILLNNCQTAADKATKILFDRMNGGQNTSMWGKIKHFANKFIIYPIKWLLLWLGQEIIDYFLYLKELVISFLNILMK
ncbi:unnamed protein product [Paramecium octaurelia]|uniref:Uncharacterized protein n=1 Tax=Paramecium octaurelia TaxID=43137 RepID=A0A8S1YRS7_PAROT|nr:unnamed protein product [Paramecium octaurelia]